VAQWAEGKAHWAFWSGKPAETVAKSSGKVALENSALGKMFDGLNIMATGICSCGRRSRTRMRRTPRRRSRSARFVGFLGEGSSAGARRLEAIEEPQFVRMLGAQSKAGRQLTWYACIYDPEDKSKKKPDALSSSTGWRVATSPPSAEAMVALAESVNEMRLNAFQDTGKEARCPRISQAADGRGRDLPRRRSRPLTAKVTATAQKLDATGGGTKEDSDKLAASIKAETRTSSRRPPRRRRHVEHRRQGEPGATRRRPQEEGEVGRGREGAEGEGAGQEGGSGRPEAKEETKGDKKPDAGKKEDETAKKKAERRQKKKAEEDKKKAEEVEAKKKSDEESEEEGRQGGRGGRKLKTDVECRQAFVASARTRSSRTEG